MGTEVDPDVDAGSGAAGSPDPDAAYPCIDEVPGLPGSPKIPRSVGWGLLVGGHAMDVELIDAASGDTARLMVGVASALLAFRGVALVPAPAPRARRATCRVARDWSG